MVKDLGILPIDYLYLDNTFCTPKEKFPAQEVAYETLKSKIKKFRDNDPNLKFYIYCYTLGKEEVALNLAKEFDTKVMVLKERWDRLQAIGIQEHF